MWGCYLCLILFLISGFKRAQAHPTQIQDNDWDYLIALQQWFLSVCIDYIDKHPFHTCSMPDKPNSWGLGGFRPRKANEVGPIFCNDSWPFDPENVKPIEVLLHQHWRNIENENKDYELWANEWKMYGSCFTIDEHLDTQLDYFSVGLYFLKYIPMSMILAEHNIIPSYERMYTLDEIYNAIVSKLRQPFIECRSEGGVQYLFQVQLCFDKNLDMIDCGLVFGKRSSGCKEGGIAYPLSDKLPIKTRSWSIVKAYELVTNLQLFNNLYDV